MSDYPTCGGLLRDAVCLPDKCQPRRRFRATWRETFINKSKGRNAIGTSKRLNPINAWLLSSKGFVHSKDLRNHLDWLFERIASRGPQIESLRERGTAPGHFVLLDVPRGPRRTDHFATPTQNVMPVTART